jgi:hypothetical protein
MPGVEGAALPTDAELAAWLASRTGASRDDIARQLAEGAERRSFVVAELLDAGLAGNELLELVVRLTGVDEAGARALIADAVENHT